MADVILTLVLRKLVDAAVRETLHLYGAGDKLDSLQHELNWISAFLKDAESKRATNERVKTWLSELQEVAYRIEDVIETFMAEADKHNRPGKSKFLRKILMNPFKVRSLVCEMDSIQKRLVGIKECTERYGINRYDLGDGSNSNDVMPRRPVILLDVEDDLDVVGFEADRENIINLLIDPKKKNRHVVSIVGQGGLGKTTLARKAYNSDKVEKEFEFRFWLSISQQFTIIDILKKMLEHIRPLQENEKNLLREQDNISTKSAIEHFMGELNASLKQKKYLIFMDDVWEKDLWDHVKMALPDVNNGSRVLMTTRFIQVAERADSTCVPYELHYLSEEESEQLMLKKAFPNQDFTTYFHELSDLPKKFVMKCGGLPLALVVVGSLLSTKSPTYQAWYNVLKKFSWHDEEGNRCMKILATSYDELPIEFKPCFLYFAAFQEDSNIKAKSLIRLWIAEGFIPEKDNTTMEDTAEDYLEQLVQR